MINHTLNLEQLYEWRPSQHKDKNNLYNSIKRGFGICYLCYVIVIVMVFELYA